MGLAKGECEPSAERSIGKTGEVHPMQVPATKADKLAEIESGYAR